ncbi:MAG: WD40 repeat domain-containing protein [Actinomycetia bacterium]|nr:WD40 repeat domain-containing protein [Actinomycetes bacterium]
MTPSPPATADADVRASYSAKLGSATGSARHTEGMGLTSVVAEPRSGPEIGVIARFDARSGKRLAAREAASAARAITLNQSGDLLVACQQESPTAEGVLLALAAKSLQTQSSAATAPFPIDVLWGANGGFVVGAQDLDQAELRLWWHSSPSADGVLLEAELTGAPEVSQDGSEVFAPTRSGIAVFNTATGELVRGRELAQVQHITLNPSQLIVGVQDRSQEQPGGTVLALDPASLATQDSHAVHGHGIDALCADPSGRYVVASQTTDKVVATLIDLAAASEQRVSGTDPAWADAIVTATSPSGDLIVVATGDWGESGVLTVYDPRSLTVTHRFVLPGPPEDLAFDTNGARLFLSSLDSDRIYPIDLTAGAARFEPDAASWRAGFGATLVLSQDGGALLTAGSLET